MMTRTIKSLFNLNNLDIKILIALLTLLSGMMLNASNTAYVYSEGWFDNLGAVESTFFFDGSYYLMGSFSPTPDLNTNEAGLWKCNLSIDGKVEAPAFIGNFNCDIPFDGLVRCSKFSSLIYNGEVYIFYLQNKNPKPLTYGPFSIYYIKSSSPDDISSWSKPVYIGIDVQVFRDEAAPFPNFADITLKTVAYNNQIYLFWNNLYNTGTGGPIYYSKFDGKSWHEKKSVAGNINYYPYFFVTTCLHRDGTEKLLLGGVAEGAGKISIYELNPWDDFSWFLDQNLGGSVSAFGPVGAVAGSVITGKQDNMIQIFFPSKSWSNLQECEMSVDSPNICFNWGDTGVATRYLWENTNNSYFNITNASLLDSYGNIQSFFIVNNRHWPLGPVGFYAFKSDAFLKTSASENIDTGSKETKEEGAWSVLGVIEGVPPFSRNGDTASMVGTSSVSYGKSATTTVSTEMKYDFNVLAKGGIGGQSPVGIYSSAKYAFSSVNNSSKSIKKSFNMNLSNTYENINGDYGWLIFSKPILKGRNYKRIPANDGNISLGEDSLVTIEDASITFEPYLLAAPPAGMYKRSPSSDFKSWQNNEFLNYEGVHCITSNGVIKADTSGGSGSIDIGIEKEFMHSSSNAVLLTISAKAAGKLLDLADLSGTIGIESRNSVTTTIADKVSAKLDNIPLPSDQGTPFLKSISVKPCWYVPDDNTSLNYMKEKPYWIPQAYSQNNLVPWCISWKVIDYAFIEKN